MVDHPRPLNVTDEQYEGIRAKHSLKDPREIEIWNAAILAALSHIPGLKGALCRPIIARLKITKS